MKTLLCAINSKYIHTNPAVYSLYESAKRYEEQNGATVGEIDIVEYTVNDVYETVLYDIMSNKSDIVAFSVYIWNVTWVSMLTRDIRKICPECIIVLGGPEVSYGTNHIDLQFDYVIEGEGERSFYSLIAKLNNDNYVPDESFDFVIKDNKVFATPIKKLSEIPFIYNDKNIDKFKHRIVYYESSRGCPYSCAYCLSSIDKGVRFLDIDRVYSDIDFFLRSDVIKQVKFVDRTFNCNPERAYSILSYIIKNTKRDDINFHFEVGADLFTDELIKLLRTSPEGLIQFEAGIQSTYEKALEESVRKTDINRCMNNIRTIINMRNINMHVDLIAGLPYENLNAFKKSFNEAYMLFSHQLQLGFLKLLNGTTLNNLVDKHEYVFSSNPPYEILSNKYMSFEDISALKKIENVLDRLYNSGRFNITLSNLLTLHKDPYSMYESIANYLDNKGYMFKAISSREIYDLLLSYISYTFPRLSDDFAKNLLLDFYASDKSDLPPLSLQYLWVPERKAKDRIREIQEERNLERSTVSTIKFIEDKVFIFDYSKKNKVSGRYDFYPLC